MNLKPDLGVIGLMHVSQNSSRLSCAELASFVIVWLGAVTAVISVVTDAITASYLMV